jgi:hypothetical protein
MPEHVHACANPVCVAVVAVPDAYCCGPCARIVDAYADAPPCDHTDSCRERQVVRHNMMVWGGE